MPRHSIKMKKICIYFKEEKVANVEFTKIKQEFKMYLRFNNRKVIDEFSGSILMVGTKATGQKLWKSDKPGMRELFVQTLGV